MARTRISTYGFLSSTQRNEHNHRWNYRNILAMIEHNEFIGGAKTQRLTSIVHPESNLTWFNILVDGKFKLHIRVRTFE